MNGGLVFATVMATICVTVAVMTCRELVEQNHNRAHCTAIGGSYLQSGDKYYSGICIKPGGLFWGRGQ